MAHEERQKRMIDILYGPIASGKSTYASYKAQTGAIVANDDAIITAIHGGDYGLYDKELKPIYKAAKTAIIVHAVDAGKDVVVDATHLRLNTRYKIVQLATTLGASCRIVVFRDGVFLGADDGRRRYKADPRGYSLASWIMTGKRHAQIVEHPTEEELTIYDYVGHYKWREDYDLPN